MDKRLTMFIISVSLYDKDGNVTNDYDLGELLDASSFEEEYLNEHLVWNTNYQVTILSLPDNNNIIIIIKHDGNLEDLITYLNDFVENSAPYHDYLMLFYTDEEGYQCSMSIDSIQPYSK